MADYSGMSMEQLNQIATAEGQNTKNLAEGAKFWQAVPAALAENRSNLDGATQRVGENWRDPTFGEAFRAPVDKGLGSMKNSEDIINSAKPADALQQLGTQIQTSSSNVSQLNQADTQLKQALQQMMQMIQQNPLAALVLMPQIQQIQQQREQLRQQAAGEVTSMGQSYGNAQGAVQAAGTGHEWNGPTGVSGDSGAPGGGVPATSGGQQDTGEQGSASGQDCGSEQGTSEDGTQQAGDTGLAGGAAAAPVAPPSAATPPAATPVAPAATPPAAPFAPVTAAGAGAVGRSIPAIAARTAGSRSTAASTSIPRAAKITGGITAAGVVQPPATPKVSTGSVDGQVAGKLTGGAGGVPMSFGGLSALSPSLGNLDGLLKQLKPMLPQQVAEGEPTSRIAGVPNALRGRTARQDDGFGVAPKPSARNRRRQEDELDTVELLDEEIWQVEQYEGAKVRQAS